MVKFPRFGQNKVGLKSEINFPSTGICPIKPTQKSDRDCSAMSDSEDTRIEEFPLAKSRESDDSSFHGSRSSFEEEPKVRKKPRLTPSKSKPPSSDNTPPKTIVTKAPQKTPQKTPTSVNNSPKPRSTPKRTEPLDGREYEILLPPTSEKILLIQLDDPNHSLDGATGAIGRIEATRESGKSTISLTLYKATC